MKIVLVHTAYQQRGGEDVAFEQEARLLTTAGHKVVEYRRSNDELAGMPAMRRLVLPVQTVWNDRSRREFGKLVRCEKPDLVHIHNTFIVTSPSIYSVCRQFDVPVVQTLHNFRLLCPAATFFRNGRVCTDCVHHGLRTSVLHGCYRGSRAATGTVAAMLAWHRWSGTWVRDVSRYVALSDFSREQFITAGFPADKITVKPNFVEPDPGPRRKPGDYALFVGRLSAEKGVRILLSAVEHLRCDYPVHIIGDGPELQALQMFAQEHRLSNVYFRGRLSREETIAAMKGASFLVLPSICYENFPMTIAEAFACGLPVLCSRLGGMQSIVKDMHTGLLFDAGNSSDVGEKMTWAIENPAALLRMGTQARIVFETRYTAERNYEMLMRVYEEVLHANKALDYIPTDTLTAAKTA